MASDSGISWTDDTVNPWIGCAKVSEACRFCYAKALDDRKLFGGHSNWGVHAPRLLRVDKAAQELRKIARRAAKEVRPRFVFIASMADVFEDRPELEAPRLELWKALQEVNAFQVRVVALLLTKRPAVLLRWQREHVPEGMPPWAWVGTTVEDQGTADERVPLLLSVAVQAGGVRFLSCEPLLEYVNISAALFTQPPAGEPDESAEAGGMWRGPSPLGAAGVTWVICGGESGNEARPMHPSWVSSLRDQCVGAGVAFHFKQWGEWVPCAYGPTDDENGQHPLYRSNRKARDGEDQLTLDEMYGRTCTVQTGVLGNDGQLRKIGDRGAFWVGLDGHQVYKVGKKVAGRTLDGRTWDERPPAPVTP